MELPEAIGDALEPLDRLLEPVARAVRRGDTAQMHSVISRLRAAAAHLETERPSAAVIALAHGMMRAIEGILGYAMSRAPQDAQGELVRSRKHALPILQAIAQQIREHVSAGSVYEFPTFAGPSSLEDLRCSLTMGDLQSKTGALAQNLKNLVDVLEEHDLVKRVRRPPCVHVFLTQRGLELLDSEMPGWQVIPVPMDVPIDTKEMANEVKLRLGIIQDRMPTYAISRNPQATQALNVRDAQRRAVKVSELALMVVAKPVSREERAYVSSVHS